MSSRQAWFNICKRCQVLFKYSFERLRIPRIETKYAQKSICVSAATVVFCEARQKLNLQAPDENSLKQGHLLKAASANTADTVTTLLSQTAYSLIETEQKYKDMVATVVKLRMYHTVVLGNEEEEERIRNIIAEAESWLQVYLKHIEDLEMLLLSVQNVVEASAEVAFLSGSEFTSTSLGERMYHASRHIDLAREQRRQANAELEKAEAEHAEALAKHADKKEKLARMEEALFSADSLEDEQQEEGQEEEGQEKEGQEKEGQEESSKNDLQEEESAGRSEQQDEGTWGRTY